jgi:hypothetical protein
MRLHGQSEEAIRDRAYRIKHNKGQQQVVLNHCFKKAIFTHTHNISDSWICAGENHCFMCLLFVCCF